MPKLINHEERKQEIAQAVWAVLTRDGIRRVSVRTVAAEAGISTGSLRHVFPSHEEMMLFALDYVGKQFIRALTDRAFDSQLIYHLEDIFVELSPVSDKGKRFITVVAGVLADASSLPGVAEVLQSHESDFIYAYSFLLSQLRAQGFVRSDINIDEEVEKLVAMLWGINCLYLMTDGDISCEELMAPMLLQFESLLEIFTYPEDMGIEHSSQEFYNAQTH